MLASVWVGRHPTRTLVRVAVLIVGSAIVFGVVLRPIRASGVSMEPTYAPGALLFCNTLAYRTSEPAQGDIVAIRLAGPNVVLVKRIVGLPGDHVRIVNGVVEINGIPFDEPHVTKRLPWNYDEVAVGGDEYFVIGDNRSMRMDLHDFGRVHRERILGRIAW
jgi:signal peptidase I